MMKKLGFTMAETLVTLGIIGVIATILLPVLSDAQPNLEQIMLKKAYYNTSRIVSELINDDEFYPDDEDTPGFSNVSPVNYRGYEFKDNSKFCGFFVLKLNIIQGGDPIALCQARANLDAGGNFKTSDDMTWSMPIGNFSGGSEDIYIDVDGPSKGNNCSHDSRMADGTHLCSAGTPPDRFVIRIDKDGHISVPSNIGKFYVSERKTNKKYTDVLKKHPEVAN